MPEHHERGGESNSCTQKSGRAVKKKKKKGKAHLEGINPSANPSSRKERNLFSSEKKRSAKRRTSESLQRAEKKREKESVPCWDGKKESTNKLNITFWKKFLRIGNTGNKESGKEYSAGKICFEAGAVHPARKANRKGRTLHAPIEEESPTSTT